jgi:hypothetical protein
MKILWPPSIPPTATYPRWFTAWLQENFSTEDIIARHCREAEIDPAQYVPVAEDAYLLRCSLAELLTERGHSCAMRGDRIEIELDVMDASVRAAMGLK